MNFSYFDTPKFLSTSLHFITCIEIPVHVFGVYMILCNTPDSMKSVKWSMFNLHVWSVFLDLSISLMTSPFALFPVLAGFPCGVLKEFGIPTPAQIFIVVVLFAFVGVAILGIFENRFYIMFAENTFWKFVRVSYFAFNYILALLFFIPPYLRIPDQDLALQQIYKELPSNLPNWITKADVFVLATDITYSLLSVFLVVIFIISEILFFIFYVKIQMKCLARTLKLSKTTLKMQQKFLDAIHFQMYTPLIILVIPLAYIGYAIYFDFYNQAANNISFIIITFHGLASTIIMLLIHKPYREVCVNMFCFKILNKTTPAGHTRLNSLVTILPVRSRI
ncbi:Serpentine Receptor, class H [Caenorhabditis elegans]|uniref:Serpentine Receptor, class H n=1 Tax=Caenorhabditis elegans TaxID=6239 RepID=Q9N5D1_CAEEL|nr:Serpentine Receptor, class H [Caenorhabditis elegans]CCD71684.1 Serpentine Receptor, class H [Caenorhabditis elegans]|eukprot:NP_503718.1 Serpentine Receptor, class H [Caenorhabditis elegans]